MYTERVLLMEEKKKIAVAMSGGVDSSVCAVLMKEKGYDVSGITLRLFERTETEKKCGTQNEINDAKNVCDKIEIPHFVCDYKGDFEKKVIEEFVKAYEKGETPNPCVNCNRDVKFRAVTESAKKHGIEYIATGHYAKIEFDEKKQRYLLKKAKNKAKDQTYFLYRLTQRELSKTVFPLGNFENKEEIRKIAVENGLAIADKSDSQDICFISEKSYVEFIEKYREKKYKKGDFVTLDGNILGQHRGIINYTVGQRKGLGISYSKPLYVVGKDLEKNRVILGEEKDLYSKKLFIKDVNFIYCEDINEPIKVEAKIRYNKIGQPAIVKKAENGLYEVEFFEPQRAVTKGQACVLYVGEYVLGGGTIV